MRELIDGACPICEGIVSIERKFGLYSCLKCDSRGTFKSVGEKK